MTSFRGPNQHHKPEKLRRARLEVMHGRLEEACQEATCIYGALRHDGFEDAAAAIERATKLMDEALAGLCRAIGERKSA